MLCNLGLIVLVRQQWLIHLLSSTRDDYHNYHYRTYALSHTFSLFFPVFVYSMPPLEQFNFIHPPKQFSALTSIFPGVKLVTVILVCTQLISVNYSQLLFPGSSYAPDCLHFSTAFTFIAHRALSFILFPRCPSHATSTSSCRFPFPTFTHSSFTSRFPLTPPTQCSHNVINSNPAATKYT